MARQLPKHKDLLVLLRYEPDTGRLFWLKRPSSLFSDGGHGRAHNRDKWNYRWAGKEAFTAVKSDGYRHGAIHGVNYTSHRVIWKMVTGQDPDEIDHIDGDRTNNRWSNLRSVPRKINRRNAARHRDNQSGATGVRETKYGWQVFITVDGKMTCLGTFADFNEAVKVRKNAESTRGFHPNHGR
jgi:HNH endonuclease